MANDLNQCNFIGRLGQDPEITYTAGGMAIGRFSIAVGYKYKDKESTTWVGVTAFGKPAEIIGEYATKGKQMFVSGRLQINEWEDKDGNNRKTPELILDRFQFLGGSESRQNIEAPNPKPVDGGGPIPF